MHDDDPAVLGHADIELKHVRADLERLPERVQRVGRKLVLTALMGDVEWRLRLDPPVGGLGGGSGGGEETEDERYQERAAHGGSGYRSVANRQLK